MITSSLPWAEQPSVCAQRLQSFRKQYEQLMQVCDRRDDERLFELFFRMGVEARSILDYSTLDLDLMNRGHRIQQARARAALKYADGVSRAVSPSPGTAPVQPISGSA